MKIRITTELEGDKEFIAWYLSRLSRGPKEVSGCVADLIKNKTASFTTDGPMGETGTTTYELLEEQ